MPDLTSLANFLHTTAPVYARMKGHSEYQDWGKHLIELGQADGLAPLRGLLAETAEDALRTEQPLNQILTKQAPSIDLSVYVKASQEANRAAAASPCSAFILSYISMLGWVGCIGREQLYGQDDAGMPHSGWILFPYVCASLSMKVGSLRGAQRLIDHSYDVLFAAKHQQDAQLRSALVAYRELAKKVRSRYDNAVRNLAGELRDSCGLEIPNLRAEFGALLWTLGLIPQSRAYLAAATAQALPSGRLCREVVTRSLETIAHDPLIQYVWLEMKDREPLNLREHEELFPIINKSYPRSPLYYTLGEILGKEPGALFARTLLRWFSGRLTPNEVDGYVLLSPEIDSATEIIPCDWGIIVLRMLYLGCVLGTTFGWPKGFEQNPENQNALLRTLIRNACAIRSRANEYPQYPNVANRMNLSLFELLEGELTPAGGDNAQGQHSEVDRAWDTLEAFRYSAFSYWMAVTPPLPCISEQVPLKSLLERERKLLSYLRGAYFLTQYADLPEHFSRFAAELEAFRLYRGDHKLNAETGRKEFADVETELKSLYDEMAQVAPIYAGKRQRETVGWADLLTAIGSHAVNKGSLHQTKSNT